MTLAALWLVMAVGGGALGTFVLLRARGGAQSAAIGP
jgi:hypothetical protein